MNQGLSVDEQMCSTKIGHFLKQYLPKKPHKWGFKLYVLCDLMGYAHKFEVYSGQENTEKLPDEPDLAKSGIHTVGTVQQNRIPNNKLPEKKNFMKKSVLRGSFEKRVSVHDGIDLSCVAWKDNKIVTLLSSYSEALPVTKVNRFDRITKGKIDITCPFIVHQYNKHMGGVDLMDSFLGRNHIKMRNAQERGEPKNSLLTMG
ncbi:PREDICTED: uncharacterized protein LOC106791973 [Polistes canadensis]|uniref:uncharacterized protein LOC106791973 n=1 Tax=Polistes canadensis TaxID=91411 RepID=UPI000718B112|nr:PREDICTED: uncharacterized protein LOC106791973 [Polistes canadensis]